MWFVDVFVDLCEVVVLKRGEVVFDFGFVFFIKSRG